jgi:hypothetical protein
VFVHRAGRTARAGRTGAVYTLLRPQDMRHFKAMASKLSLPAPAAGAGAGAGGGGSAGGGAGVAAGRELRLPPEEVGALRPALAAALQQVEALLEAEGRQDAGGAGREVPGGGGGGGGGGGAAAPGGEGEQQHRKAKRRRPE